MALASRREAAILPTGRYALVILAIAPPALAAAALGGLLTGAAAAWFVGAAVVVALVVTVLRERHIRTMPAGWQAFWLALGLAVSGVVASALFLAIVSAGFLVICSGDGAPCAL